MVTVHHIGARDATQPLPHLAAFAADITTVLIEADVDSAEDIRRLSSTHGGRVVVVSACIAGGNGARTFRHACSPYASSLLAPNPALNDCYLSAHWVPCDYTLGDALATARTERVGGITLDALIASRSEIPLPDVISLDTQGSELEILEGSPSAREHAVAIVCEVEFLPLYDQQPLFGDVAGFLHAQGFVFCGFADIHAGSYYRGPVGLRGRHVPVTTDALFLRHPATIAGTIDAPLRARKLAFVALIHGHLEYAQWALALIRDEPPPGQAVAAWQAFVEEFRSLAAGFPNVLPDRFGETRDSAPADAAFATRLRQARSLLESHVEAMQAFWSRYGLQEVGELQRERFHAVLRQYGVA